MGDNYFGKWLSNPPEGDEVVITGVSGRLPESNNVYEYRDNLFNKKDMVTSDGRRWMLNHSEVPQRTAKIFDIDQFDAGFFGVHYCQADSMDPMIRKFLETSIEAIIDAGVNPSELQGTRTGVFVGTCFSETEIEMLKSTETQEMRITGTLKMFLPNRLSYYLKLKGPSYVVDTACSSSLNALEHALKAIRTGECDSAVIGGANILIHPGLTLQFARMGMLSKDGRCKVFDQNADGYVRGEAVASVFLQKRKDAKRVYAQVLYGKINFDGFKSLGITFPSSQMQAQLMTEIFEDSGFTPSDLSYLEAHATGTQVGDPEEVEAIDEAIAKKREKPLLIGSVKSSIGHSEPVSGLCSLIKVIIAMETGRIPPNINLEKIKKGMVGFEEGRLKVVTETTDLEGDDAVIGLNNFGFGGNNCHLLVKRFSKKKINGGLPNDDIPRLVCVSGRNERAVLTLLNDLSSKQVDTEYVGLLHEIFKNRILNNIFRGYSIISKTGSLKTSTKYCFDEIYPLFIYFGNLQENFRILGKYLLDFQIFKTTISRIDSFLPPNISVMDTLTKDDNKQFGAFAVQLGVVDILNAIKLDPTAVYGDNLGRILCAYYYKSISLEEAVLTAYKAFASGDISYLEPATVKKHDRYIIKRHSSLDKIVNSFEKFSGLPNVRCLRNSKILNISDNRLGDQELVLVDNNIIQFLEILGCLYEQGHDLHLQELYPKIQYPVSRGTAMISPMIKWNYKKSWFTYKFKSFVVSDLTQKEYQFTYMLDEYKFLTGHVVDGRNLFPATGYLYIVWQTYLESRKLAMDTMVVFENCKFVRPTIMRANMGILSLTVFIQIGTGKFEVLNNDLLVVTGRIYSPEDTYQTDLPPIVLKEEDSTFVLDEDEVYRELQLRGYNYSGLFKGLVKCNVEATTGLIKWENNWIAFMDKMLQLKILNMNTRLLYVPIGIKKLVIEPSKFLGVLRNEEECLVPVYVYKEQDILKTAGIEYFGLQARAIPRRISHVEPVLERYEFVPNNTYLDLNVSLRVATQIVLENSLEYNFKALEITEDFIDQQVLLPFISKILEDVPLVNPDLVISTKATIENIPGVKVEDFNLTQYSNLLLLIGTKILQRDNITELLATLSQFGFVLTREEIDFVPDKVEDVKIVCEHMTKNEKLILFQKSGETAPSKFIQISQNYFEWLPQLQNSLKHEQNIVVYSQNQDLNGIIGLVNCIRREPGGRRVKCFFMVDESPKFNPQIPFYKDQISKNVAINVYKNSQWGTYRHLLLEEVNEVESEHCYANELFKGDLSSLKWIEGNITPWMPLNEDSVLICNYYASINFKDIMLASGRISVDVVSLDRQEQECPLGFEYSGRDLSGRRVMGIINNGGLSTLILANKNLLWAIPDTWSLEDAATVPVVYCTVIVALFSVTSSKPGSSILIHSATGGVGLAALNVCLYHDWNVFVTVGTEEKKHYLKKHFPQIEESHIGNSHDTSFEMMVKAQTNGRGVDIVLNSLSEEKLIASVKCLARGGKFLEIGKFDLANNNELNLLLLEKECSYHGIMVDTYLKQPSEKLLWLFNRVNEGMKSGFIKPLPRTSFKKNEVEAAFRYMTTGKHIGKVLINIREEEVAKIVQPATIFFKGMSRYNCMVGKSYIIIGGLGGLGLELSDWLVLRGAKKLVLVSSSGVKTGYQRQRMRIWQSYGIDVHISKNDVTTNEGCNSLIKEASQLGPIDAIFNLAVVLKDALFEEQTEENFRISLAPKAEATIYLDQVTRKLCPTLRQFVVFSSVSCGRGNIGQTNYGMANSIMERVCEKRKRDGLPALAIQWGAIGEVGLVAKMQKEDKELVIGGTLQQKVSSCLEVLDKFLKQEHPVVASTLVAEKRSKLFGDGSIVATITDILGIKDLTKVNLDSPLAELGMDSMTGTEVIQVLEKDYEIYLTSKDIRTMTFAKLMEFEAERNKNNDKTAEDTVVQGIKILLQYIPDGKISSSPITELSTGNEIHAATIFVFPGITGDFTILETFTSKLRGRIFAVHYNFQKPADSIQEIVKNILPYMEEKLDNDQGCYIIGYSFGAIVALESTALLENKGYQCSLIAIDGAPAYLQSSSMDFFQDKSQAEIEDNMLIAILEPYLPRQLLLENKEQFLKSNVLEDRLDSIISVLPTKFKHILDKQGIIALYKRFKSVLDYRFTYCKVKSPIHLFRAAFPMYSNIDDDYKLSELSERSVNVTEIDGDHATIINQTKLAEKVNKLL